MSDDSDIEHGIDMAFAYADTQADLAKRLRALGHRTTDLLADLLEPQGRAAGFGEVHWKLILRRAKRGPPRREEPGTYSHYYDQEVENGGERGAVKRLAGQFKMSPDAIRSALRREAGTHDGRRQRKRGRK
jgi:hypothetical protein